MSAGPGLDALAAALAALDHATVHGYTREAATAAAAAQLADLDADRARAVAATLAGLLAWWSVVGSWSADASTSSLDLDGWVRYGRCRVANGEEP